MQEVPTSPPETVEGFWEWIGWLVGGASVGVSTIVGHLYKSNVSLMRDRIEELANDNSERKKVIDDLTKATIDCEKHRARLEEKCNNNEDRIKKLEDQLKLQ
jgi:hypothetical protein